MDRELKAVCETLNRIEGAVIPQVETPEGGTIYEPWHRGPFIEGVIAGLEAINHPIVRLLGVGCGIGSNLLIAAYLDPRVELTGLEVVPEYCRIASVLIGDKGHIIQGDARTWDFEYGNYDFIFISHPFSDWSVQEEVEMKIRTRMHHGAVLYVVGHFHGGEGWTRLHDHWPVFQKG